MYAVVEVGGMQWKIAKADTIRVPKIEAEAGKSIELDRILLVVDKEKVTVGKPVVPDVSVKAMVVSHGKADKVMVFKKKRRKDYKVLRGHRQEYTELRIDGIAVGQEQKKSAAPQKEEKKTASAPTPAKKKKTAPAGKKKEV